MTKRCPDCHQRTSTPGRCPNCRAEHAAEGVDHDDVEPTCAGCGDPAPAGDYTRPGVWLCPGCQPLGLTRAEREQVAAESATGEGALAQAVRWAVGDADAYPHRGPALEGFERASKQRLMADGGVPSTVECCPHEDCRCSDFRPASKSPRGTQAAGNYWCHGCNRHFDAPDERERYRQGTTRRGLAATLADPAVSGPEDVDGGEA